MRYFISLSVLFVISTVATAETTDDLVFIHHSCGSNWMSNYLHSALLAKDYIDERNDITYGTDVLPDTGRPDSLASNPGNSTNMNHWIRWFNDYLAGAQSHGCADGFNKIIMFKSCYPASNIGSEGTEPGDPFSSSKTTANYKAVFRHYNGPGNTYTNNSYIYKPLEDVFAENPDVLFVPVTAPPLHYTATNDANAHRARLFNNWLKEDWLDSYKADNNGLGNVAVFDWFDVLAYPDDHAEHPNRLKEEYGGASGNSHPNAVANSYSTEVFADSEGNFIDKAWNDFILPGDLDDSDFVGQDDLDIVLGEWGNSPPLDDPRADPSWDNFVGQDDLDIVLGDWGNGLTTIPEPTTIILLVIGAAAMFRKKTGKSSALCRRKEQVRHT